MKPFELNPLMKSLNFHPSRNLGQNFLTDDNMLASIVTLSGVKEGDNVLEIGPGFGALTHHLIDANLNITAIEFDYRLAQYIRELTQETPHFQLIEGDAVRIDYDTVLEQKDFHLVANLPYCCSTPLMMTLSQLVNPPLSMTVMLQKEVGERICATPQSKAYGALSVCLQMFYQCKFERVVPPEVFHPVPEVDSALITLRRIEPLPDLAIRKQLIRIVKTAFSQRRKVMAKLLGFYMDRKCVEDALESLGIRKDARAELITPQQFFQLGLILPKPSQPNAKKSKQDRALKRGKFAPKESNSNVKEDDDSTFDSDGDLYF